LQERYEDFVSLLADVIGLTGKKLHIIKDTKCISLQESHITHYR